MTTLPIAEHFHSIQGEGTNVGTPMHFIRLAGCNVGTLPAEKGIYHTCHALGGGTFTCDTDYQKKEDISIEDLIRETYEPWISLTGGEPFIHKPEKLHTLFKQCAEEALCVQVETSGTIVLSPFVDQDDYYIDHIACSPKAGFLPYNLSYIHELKFLIGSEADVKTMEHFMEAWPDAIRNINTFIQPINFIAAPNRMNIQLCLEVLKRYPYLKLSAQLHKYLELR